MGMKAITLWRLPILCCQIKTQVLNYGDNCMPSFFNGSVNDYRLSPPITREP
uniref:Uncharacterized protein n=1 Tax=Anguilla anguilla TaxID=7936 RepID=A0A0E9QAM3_ANGAN